MPECSADLEWRDGELVVHLRTGGIHQLTLDAEAVIMTPSVFVDRALFCAGEPPGVPAPRTALIVYPAAQVDCLPSVQDHPLIGAMRLKLLAELSQPRSTAELAQRLYLRGSSARYSLIGPGCDRGRIGRAPAGQATGGRARPTRHRRHR
ncbi:hypothetical protein OG535_39485 [Kitasatospora sp. NBC_00085]|uniref:hypothetical protein n=1 Tax=Kitasatospora sp. NBC_00085 TaxID=2903566 RepID=UPI0032447AEF